MERRSILVLFVGSGICTAIAGAWCALWDSSHQTMIEASPVRIISNDETRGTAQAAAIAIRPSQKDLELCAQFRIAELAMSLVPLSDDESRFVRDLSLIHI